VIKSNYNGIAYVDKYLINPYFSACLFGFYRNKNMNLMNKEGKRCLNLF